MARRYRHKRYESSRVKHAVEPALQATSARVLTGGDEAAYEQFVEREVAKLHTFVGRLLEYHDALNDLAANEVDAYDIVDEAFARTIARRAGADGRPPLTPYRQLQAAALEVVHEKVAELEERERRETSLEGNARDPDEEDGFRTLGEHVLDFWQPDQDLSQLDFIPDEATPTPSEVEDMRERQHEIYAALNALPRRWREDFVLFATDGWTVKELADLRTVTAEVVQEQLAATQHFLLERLRERSLLENRPARQLPHQHRHG